MDESDDSSYSNSEDSDIHSRPNRFDGPPSTWRNLTEQDRAINTSLIQQRNEDLSIHLYNAHALKRRVRDAKDEEAQDKFVPPKVWTAWPLPPEIVPREDEVVGEDDGLEDYTLRRGDKWRPSRVLEDVLVGGMLRVAKDRFDGREWAESDEEEDANVEDGGGQEVREGDNVDAVMGENEDEEQPAMKPVISADDDRSRELLRPTVRHNLSRLDDLLMALHNSRRACLRAMSEDSEAQTDITECNMTNQEQNDGEISERIPSTPSPKKQKTPHRRGRGRPRKYESASTPSRKETVVEESPSPAKKSNRGRPKKEYPRLVGESDYEYALRVARIRKEALPPPPLPPPATKSPTTTITEPESPPFPITPNRNRVKKRRTSETELKGEARWNLRDWSEVLGAAAIIGFEEDVLDRAARRCADLFGEGMVFRRLGVGLGRGGEVVTYLPGVVSSVETSGGEGDGDEVEVEGEDDDEGDEDEDDEHHNEGNNERDNSLQRESNEEEEEHAANDDPSSDNTTKTKKPQRRPRSKMINEKYWCPIPSCLRSKHGFGKGNHLRRHLIGQHGYEASSVELKNAIGEGKERGGGGSGRGDGFLEMVSGKRKGRGRDIEARKPKTKTPRKDKSSNIGGKRKRVDSGTEDDDRRDDDRQDEDEGEDENLDLEGCSDQDESSDEIGPTQEQQKRSPKKTRAAKETGNRERREMQEWYGIVDEGSGSDFEMDDDDDDA